MIRRPIKTERAIVVNPKKRLLHRAENTLGDVLRDWRLYNRRTLGEIAEVLGISQRYLQYLETNERRLASNEDALSIANLLQIDVDEVWAMSGKAPPDMVDAIGSSYATIKRVRKLLNLEPPKEQPR